MRFEANTGKDDARSMLAQIPGVKDVSEEKEGEYSLFQMRLEANADPREELMRLAGSRQWSVRELLRRRPTLEDVFVELTHSDS
jgi:ABC-2 type transport system ATP-binding protein